LQSAVFRYSLFGMSRALRLALAVFLLAGCGKGLAQGAHFADRNEVRAVQLDPSHEALWYATGGGLVRLDLAREIYQVLSRAEGIPSADLTALVVLDDSRLVAGTADWGVILRNTGGKWARAGLFDGVPHERVFHLSLSDFQADSVAPSVWVGTLRGARKLAVRTGFIEPERASSVILADYPVYDIAEDTSGAVFFATNSGVWRMDPSADFTRYGFSEGVGSLEVTEIERGPEGAIYIAYGKSLACFKGEIFIPVAAPFGGSTITDLRLLGIGKEKVLAVGAGERIYYMHSGGSWVSGESFGQAVNAIGPVVPNTALAAAGTATAGLFWPDKNGEYRNLRLPGPLYNVLTRVALDNRGIVWTSSASDDIPADRVGVNRFDMETWTHFTQSNSPLVYNMVSSLNAAPDGRIYLGTWFGPSGTGTGGFNIFDDNNTADPADDLWETFIANTSGLSMDVIRGDMAFDPGGGVWIASRVNMDQPGGLDHFDPVTGAFTSYSTALAERNVHTVESDGLGNIWIGYVNRGLAVIPGGFSGGAELRDVETFRTEAGETGIVDLAADRVNRLWIATATKVILLNFQEDATDESKFAYREVKPPSFAGLAVYDIEIEGYKAVWFATADGIYRLSMDGEGDWTVLNRGNSTLASDRVYDLAIDEPRGVVWAATAGGLSTLNLSAAGEPGLEGLKLVVRPNPWYPERRLLLDVSGMPRYSRISILTVNGERVRSFAPGENASEHFFWDGSNSHGRKCASGVYLIQARAPDGRTFIGKVALVR